MNRMDDLLAKAGEMSETMRDEVFDIAIGRVCQLLQELCGTDALQMLGLENAAVSLMHQEQPNIKGLTAEESRDLAARMAERVQPVVKELYGRFSSLGFLLRSLLTKDLTLRLRDERWEIALGPNLEPTTTPEAEILRRGILAVGSAGMEAALKGTNIRIAIPFPARPANARPLLVHVDRREDAEAVHEVLGHAAGWGLSARYAMANGFDLVYVVTPDQVAQQTEYMNLEPRIQYFNYQGKPDADSEPTT